MILHVATRNLTLKRHLKDLCITEIMNSIIFEVRRKDKCYFFKVKINVCQHPHTPGVIFAKISGMKSLKSDIPFTNNVSPEQENQQKKPSYFDQMQQFLTRSTGLACDA
jgi:hypothetical protein